MIEITIRYQGQLHCELTHGPSGRIVETDAPKDNNGRGESFSPTDIVAGALGSCILTVMGIAAMKDGLRLEGAQVRVTKEMATNPRRIGRLTAEVTMPAGLSKADREKLEAIAHNCPVAKSLHPELDQVIRFSYPD